MIENLAAPPPALSPLLTQDVREDVCDALAQAVRAGRHLDLRLRDTPPDFHAPEGAWILRLAPAGILVSVRGLEPAGELVPGAPALAPSQDAQGFRALAHLPSGDPEDIIMSVEDALGWGPYADGVVFEEAVGDPAQEETGEEFIPEEMEVEGGAAGGGDPFARFGADLVEEARAGRLTPALHRDEEIRALATALCKREKKSVMIVGEAGTGKTAVVEGLAQWIADGRVPDPLRDVRIISVNIPMESAGRSHLNEFEGHLKALVDLARGDAQVILFFDEAHTLMAPGSNGSQLLKADLGRGLLRVIGATTAREFREIEKDRALERRFQVLPINELGPEQAADVVLARIPPLTEHHGVEIGPDLVRYGVRRAKWGAPRRVNPDVAIDLIDESAAIAGVSGDGVLTIDHIHRALSRWRGLPPDRLGLVRPPREYFESLRNALLDRVPGQARAIAEVVKVIERRSQIPFTEQGGGVRGSFLIVEGGDTGMTGFVEAMAELLFDRNHLVRIDGSTFTEEHQLASLWGAPPGYVGHGQGGLITNALRDKRHGVLWLEDAHRTHPAVLDALLPSLLDEGVVLDMNTGERLDASQFLVVLTAAVEGDVPAAGFARGPGDASRQALLARAQELVPRDIRRRLDAVLTLEPISRDTARLLLERRAARLVVRLEARVPSVSLAVEEDVFGFLLDRSPARAWGWGVRQLETLFSEGIEEEVERVLAQRSQEPGTITVYLNEEGERRLRFVPSGRAVSAHEPALSPQD